MKALATGALAMILFVVDTPLATAAGTVRVDVFPEQPRAGQLVTIQVRTFVLLERTPPVSFPLDFHWSIAALPPYGEKRPIRVARDSGNPFQWTGTFRFPSRGTWTVCVFNMQPFSLLNACSPSNPGRVVVRVRPRRSPDVWARLYRPFRIPTIDAGVRCPKTEATGAAQPAGFDDGVLRYLDPIPTESLFFGSSWFGNKVLWKIDPAYRGRVLIRGRQVDGPNELRFDRGLVPPRAIRIDSPARDRPSFTRVRAPGCYAYQVDGESFTDVIVFEARPF